jgi:hypothetical protein
VAQVFYANYVKKLRISQYLIEERLNGILLEPKETEIKLPKEFVLQNKYDNLSSKEFK